ncbi:hypothetical protein [Legionella tucsonensis]|uniref:Membrane-associated HD superfamily hydrolase n=1 Tax=Legionella tucsonensis TaxID=40335 RepID=A0A0W0ZW37_9GAMM|nr:hypothetical protein [Legionella tucsonensis]KTD73357.1 membrane-associated HD superfamily hydrolase [Legionella tucsonensis]
MQSKDEANKLLEEKAEELRKKSFKEEKEEFLLNARREEQLAWSNFMARVRESSNVMDERTGKETTYWDQIKKLADDVINSEQTSINDWRSNMMSLLNLFAKLNKAINISSNQVSAEFLNLIKGETNYSPTLKALNQIPLIRAITHPKEIVYQGVKAAILHAIKGEGEFDVEAFKQKVTFEDGKVKIARLTYADDGIPLENEDKARKAFNKFVEIWLMENEYVPSPQKDGTYVHFASGAVLDQDTFNRLNDPQAKTNLGKFLDANAKFKFEDEAEAQSGLTPNNS